MKTILTTMCMIINEKDNTFLVQLRKKNDWPGINFPGGHVEENESIEESCIREVTSSLPYLLIEGKDSYSSNLVIPVSIGYPRWSIG